jgi:hypothetical protein
VHRNMDTDFWMMFLKLLMTYLFDDVKCVWYKISNYVYFTEQFSHLTSNRQVVEWKHISGLLRGIRRLGKRI